jgi:hypothetical protein
MRAAVTLRMWAGTLTTDIHAAMKQERQSNPEIERDLTRAFAEAFIARWDLRATQRRDGRYVCVKKPLELAHVERHLRGAMTLGAYALDTVSRARWLCLDADDEPGWEGLLALARALEGHGVTPYLEESRRGGHLWLFTPPLAGRDARRLGNQLLAGLNLTGIELFPKQEALTTGPGSLVRLPLGVHRKTGRRYHFITVDGAPLAPTIRGQLEQLARPQVTPPAFIAATLARAAESRPAEELRRGTPADRAGAATDELLSERLKRRISVYDFVSQYVALDAQGRGLCPFHDDQHASFSVDRAGDYWHCFAGCGGGSIIHFWQKWRETQGQDPDFVATIRELAAMLL